LSVDTRRKRRSGGNFWARSDEPNQSPALKILVCRDRTIARAQAVRQRARELRDRSRQVRASTQQALANRAEDRVRQERRLEGEKPRSTAA
jgi:hypothetical protein